MQAVDLNVGNSGKYRPITMEGVRKAVRADLENVTRIANECKFHCMIG